MKLLLNYDVIIYIAPPSVKPILKNIGENTIHFINVREPLETISKEIRIYSSLRIPNEPQWQPILLTQCEKRTLNLLLKGYKPSRISRILNLNEKTISLQKRNAMKKYNVCSMAELFIKHRVIEEMNKVIRGG